MRRRLALVPVLAVALLTIAGCSAAAPETDDEVVVGTDELPVDSGDGTLHDCLLGTWNLDTARQAQQLQERFAENGAEITSTTIDGSVVLTVDDTIMSYNSGVTYTMQGTISGIDAVIEQWQVGVSEGRWTENDGVLGFAEWEPGVAVTNKVTLAGAETDLGVDFPEDYGSGAPTAVACSGAALELTPDGSPFTTYWVRQG